MFPFHLGRQGSKFLSSIIFYYVTNWLFFLMQLRAFKKELIRIVHIFADVGFHRINHRARAYFPNSLFLHVEIRSIDVSFWTKMISIFIQPYNNMKLCSLSFESRSKSQRNNFHEFWESTIFCIISELSSECVWWYFVVHWHSSVERRVCSS